MCHYSSVVASGIKWASEFFRVYGENDIESHYNAALIHEFEQICLQADRDRTMTGNTDIAVGLDTLGQNFRKQGRVREACKYLAIACGYLELKKDLSMLYNVMSSFTEQKKRECKYPSFSSTHFLRFPVSWPWPKISAVLNQRSSPFRRLRMNSAGVMSFNDECVLS